MKYATWKDCLDAQRAWTASTLCEMVRIPSESGQEEAMARYLLQKIRSTGAAGSLVPIDPSIRASADFSDPVPVPDYGGRHNVLASVTGRESRGRRTLALNTHMDVVPPSKGQTDAYAPRLDEHGRLYGRGACDAKGQLAVMLLLLKISQEFRPPRHSFLCHMAAEEEIGGNGTLSLLHAGQAGQIDMAVNLEPTALAVKTSIRGAVWFSFRFTGVAGHAGSQRPPVSALDKALAAAGLLQDYHRALLERSAGYGLFRDKPNPLPLTIGRLTAGDHPSMTPCAAQMEGVIGLLPNVTSHEVTAALEELFARPENAWIADGMTLRFPYRHNAVELPPEHPLAAAMGRACRQWGLDGTPDAMTASSDAIFYHERGIPTLAFGPGRLSDAHSKEEQIKIDDILQAAAVLYTLLDQELPERSDVC